MSKNDETRLVLTKVFTTILPLFKDNWNQITNLKITDLCELEPPDTNNDRKKFISCFVNNKTNMF
jgi:hypothetical protein